MKERIRRCLVFIGYLVVLIVGVVAFGGLIGFGMADAVHRAEERDRMKVLKAIDSKQWPEDVRSEALDTDTMPEETEAWKRHQFWDKHFREHDQLIKDVEDIKRKLNGR